VSFISAQGDGVLAEIGHDYVLPNNGVIASRSHTSSVRRTLQSSLWWRAPAVQHIGVSGTHIRSAGVRSPACVILTFRRCTIVASLLWLPRCGPLADIALEDDHGREPRRRRMTPGDTDPSQSFVRARHPAGASAGHPFAGAAANPALNQVTFNRRELDRILGLYGRMVAAGEWRDYAIDFLKDRAVFSIFRRASEVPIYRIEKDPRLARKQGVYSAISATGLIMRRGHDLDRVLRVLDKSLRLVRS
jgi:hypothetical protein